MSELAYFFILRDALPILPAVPLDSRVACTVAHLPQYYNYPSSEHALRPQDFFLNAFSPPKTSNDLFQNLCTPDVATTSLRSILIFLCQGFNPFEFCSHCNEPMNCKSGNIASLLWHWCGTNCYATRSTPMSPSLNGTLIRNARYGLLINSIITH